MPENKIPMSEAHAWERAYFHGTEQKGQRYGQAFMNHFHGRVPHDDHELWEELNVGKARSLTHKYIDFSPEE